MENQKKIEYLQSIGLKVEWNDDETVAFESDYSSDIRFDEFEIGDSAEDICNRANIYSCCGDILDRDWMLCPSCREHC
jgi:hypothetical protein